MSDATISPSEYGQIAGWSAAVALSPSSEAAAKGQLEPGSMLGDRYEILQLLGQGGMGAVYKARDVELERTVALKLIRPDLASHPEILRRFKQELILAREVTHPNVIRIYDLGQASGVRYITMEYVEGRDLRALLHDKGKLTPEEAVPLFQQIAAALEAAHHAGVVHRDLKPQNIMVDKGGRVYVMDFGVARSLETPGMTETGALMGTPEYMSPEQAKGMKVDARSDLFSLGIIFYEMLSGVSPFKADTAMATMFKRTRERAVPLAQAGTGVPVFLSDIVSKCLEIDREQRYPSARAIIEDLEKWKRGTVRSAMNPVARWLKYAPRKQKWLAAGIASCLVLAAAYAVRDKLPLRFSMKPAASVQPVSLAILPFRNASTDLTLDWLGPSLADMLSTGVGQSSRLRTVSSDRVHQILKDLRVSPNADFDPDTLQRLAEFSGAEILVWGHYAKFGEQIRIDAILQDLKHNRRVPLKIEAKSEKEIPGTVDQLADLIRKNLAVSTDVLKELKASSFEPTSISVAALRDYNQGVRLLGDGKNLEAVKALQAAVQEDPEFAMAFAKLGQTYANLGHDNEAEQSARKAVDLGENLPAREKYLITANYARIERDYPKAIESYEKLVSASPDDLDAQFAIGRLYEDTSVFDRARVHYSKVLSGDPRNVTALLAMGRLEIRSGNPQVALEFLNRAQTLAIQLGNDEARAMALQGFGTCYKRLNKQDEALRNFQQALEIRRRLGDKRGTALSLNTTAQIQVQMGKPDEALKNYQEALQLRKEIGDKSGIGDTLLDLGMLNHDRGHYDEALKLFKESLQVERELGDERNQALCLNDIGNSYFFKGDYEDALTYFQQSLQLREKSKIGGDIGLTLHNLAETSAKMGQYGQALSYYVRALDLYRSSGDKRGAAMETYSMGTLFGYQGRFGSAMNSKQEALKTFKDMQDHSFWMTEIQSGVGIALADAGRIDDAQKALDEALASARELKNDGSISQVLNYQGDCFFYRKDFKSARRLYEQALQLALHSKDRDKVMLSKFNIAKITLKQGRAAEASAALRKFSGEADSLGLKYLSLESSVYLGEALLEAKDYGRARQELERAAAKAEKLELRSVLAQDQYLLATALRLSGRETEATSHYRQALRYLDEIRKDAGSDAVLQRSDLNSVYTESTRWSGSAKS